MIDNIIQLSKYGNKCLESASHLMATQIKQKLNIYHGKCLEISSDEGQMGTAFAEITDYDVYLYDISELSLTAANKRIHKRGLNERMTVLPWNSYFIPVEKDTMDLVVGVKSIWFLSDYVKALNEIYRVLAPKGVAYIRLGNILKKSKSSYGNRRHKVTTFICNRSAGNSYKLTEQLIQAISKTDIKNFEISDELSGVWIFIKKE
jgi:ubiquinone/menaquinone biosynthesis C-methylase UbiE